MSLSSYLTAPPRIDFYCSILYTSSPFLLIPIFSRATPDPAGTARLSGASMILPKYTLLSERMVRNAHRKGILVVPWTLNGPEAWERALSLGVDGFATDDPCAARDYLSCREENTDG